RQSSGNGTDRGFSTRVRDRSHRFLFPLRGLALALSIAAAAACKEQGTIQVHKITFRGVQSVDEDQLAKALATHESSKLPWGKKNNFNRSRFDADLARIRAFYADRGYPDARVASFDVKLNKAQTAVDVTLTISEGQPVILGALDFVGFDVIPPDHLQA